MKLYGIAIGAGLGYLAGNESARTKTLDALKRWKASPQAKAVEDKMSSTATQLSSKVTGKGNTQPTPLLGGADAADTSDRTASLTDVGWRSR